MKLKILILASWYPTMEMPQSGIFFQQQASMLSKHYDVKVLVCDTTPMGKKGFLKSIYRKQNSQIKYVQSSEFEVITFNVIDYVFLSQKNRITLLKNQWIKSIKQLFKSWRPDIMHSHDTWYAGVIAHRINEEINIPFVITSHSPLFINKDSSYKNSLILNAVENANQLITVGSQDKRIFESILHLNNQAKILGNLIKVELFNPLNKKQPNSNVFKIIQITSTSTRKDIPTFLKSIHHFINNFQTSYKLEVILIASPVNDGYNLELLKQDIFQLNLQEYINVKYNLPHEIIFHELATSQLFISTSYYETFGVSIAEAIAMGIPTIVVDNGASSDFVKEGINGLFVQPGDYQKIALYIHRIIEREIQFNEDVMHESIASKYSSESYLQMLDDIYFNILKS